MMRKLSSWNSRPAFSRKNRQQKSRRARRVTTPHTTQLGAEWLEERIVLASADPVLTAIAGPIVVNEGAPFTITNIGTFTDVVEGTTGGGGSTGLNPMDYSSLGAFTSIANISIDTGPQFGAAPTLTWGGAPLTGTTVIANIGAGNFEIAVFTFSSFLLSHSITTTGSRPLALLSQGSMTIGGTIDVSARFNGDITLNDGQQIAGPGGGNGGLGTNSTNKFNGDPAAGAPANSVGQWDWASIAQLGGGTGGGFGGKGGKAERNASQGNPNGFEGMPFANLATAIQGGSGGATAGSPNSSGTTISGGGGGGGGIELGAVTSLTIQPGAQIKANGGNAHNGTTVTTNQGGGGGGAGGGILIHAPTVNQLGTLEANGGTGGVAPRGGGGGGGGAIMIVHSTAPGSYTGSGMMSANGGTAPGTDVPGTLENGDNGPIDIIAEAPSSTPIIETFNYVIDWNDPSPNSTALRRLMFRVSISTMSCKARSMAATRTQRAACTWSI